MATVTTANVNIFRGNAAAGSTVTVTRSWYSRLAGTAFVETTPMSGFVVAIALSGPVIVGVSDVNPDGTWQITNIAQQYAGVDLLVLGIPRASGNNYAAASRIHTVP